MRVVRLRFLMSTRRILKIPAMHASWALDRGLGDHGGGGESTGEGKVHG